MPEQISIPSIPILPIWNDKLKQEPVLDASTKIEVIEKKIIKNIYKASKDFGLIEANDHILVALSGGKDSYAMAWALKHIQAAAPFELKLTLYHLDQAQPGHDTKPIEGFMKEIGLPYEVEYQDTYTKVVSMTPEGKAFCSACSRFRRAILYKAANRHGCNKVALGHHADDLIETLLMNLIYSGRIRSMPPKLASDDGTQILIRPLCYVKEKELALMSQLKNFPIVPCNLCGSQATKRQFIKKLLTQLENENEHLKGNLLHALSNVSPSHLLDKKLFPFLNNEKF